MKNYVMIMEIYFGLSKGQNLYATVKGMFKFKPWLPEVYGRFGPVGTVPAGLRIVRRPNTLKFITHH